MTQELVRSLQVGLPAQMADRLPPMVAADERTVCRFMDWCKRRGLHGLRDFMPIHVVAYVEHLPLSRASVRQHLSAISRCFDCLVSGGVPQTNPATSVQRPRHVVRVGKTPVLNDEEARTLLESIPTEKVGGLRDRALIGAMLYTFGRVGVVIAMDVEDYLQLQHGAKCWVSPRCSNLFRYVGWSRFPGS